MDLRNQNSKMPFENLSKEKFQQRQNLLFIGPSKTQILKLCSLHDSLITLTDLSLEQAFI